MRAIAPAFLVLAIAYFVEAANKANPYSNEPLLLHIAAFVVAVGLFAWFVIRRDWTFWLAVPTLLFLVVFGASHFALFPLNQ